ncbi:MAG: hypothetical protein AB2L20_24735 [Mangrovibacterium sp.]
MRETAIASILQITREKTPEQEETAKKALNVRGFTDPQTLKTVVCRMVRTVVS